MRRARAPDGSGKAWYSAVMTGSSEFEMGRAIGIIAAFLLCFAALANAARRMSDDRYSRRCAFGSSMVFAGWLVVGLGALAIKVFGESWGVNVAGLMLTVPLVGIGAVLALLGWIEAAAHDRLGRGLATWALILSVLFGVGALEGLSKGMSRSSAKYRPPSDWIAAMPEAGSKMEFPAKGFAFVAPAAPWTRIKPERVNPRADLYFVHEEKGVFLGVIATRLPADAEITDEEMAEGSREEVLAADKNAAFGEIEEGWAGEVPGLRFGASSRLQGQEKLYRFWVHVESEFAYQLVAWCPSTSAGVFEALSQEIFNSFQLREP
jgi:hypothetical protein